MYTTALEMHIEVLQGLQKVSGYTADMFVPEEIDLHLNKQQNRLIENILVKGFEDLENQVDYIRPLITTARHIPVYIPQTTDVFYEPKTVYGLLPPDYRYLIADRSKVVTSTAAGLCKDLSALKNTVATTVDYTEYVAAVPMVVSIATASPYFYNFQITLTIGGTPTVVLTAPSGLNNLKSNKSGFYISNYVLENFNYPGVVVYWEYYREGYYPGCFVFVTGTAGITAVTLTTQISSGDIANGGSQTASFGSTVFKKPVYNSTTVAGYQEEYITDTLKEADEIHNQHTNVFYRSLPNNPKTLLTGRKLVAYESKSFLISELLIDYVRIPRQISLSLNQITEMGGNAPSIIVDRTVEYLKMVIENPNYGATLQDNRLRDQI